ncbi:MAG TPA: restriction endonuclease subunit S [Flavobacteriales bacterium]|nr:restriction endonuclease subunit S [Flavobacteriales bacterium]
MSTTATAAPAKAALPNEGRPGYKHTKLGWIPEEWEVTRYGEMTTLLTNGFVGTATTHYTDAADGVPYVQGYNVKEFTIDYHGMCKVNRTFHEKNAKSCLREGDLLTIQTGDIGVTSIVPDDLAGANCHALVISRFKQDAAFAGYYLQYLNSPIGRAMIRRIETGSTMKHINVGDLKRELVIQPTGPEQRRIAAVLGAWDQAIATAQQLLAAQQERKRGLMNTVLSDVYHHRHKASIGDIAEEIGERNPDGTEHIVLSCSKHKGFVSSLEYFKKQVYSEDRSNYKVIRRGQFGFPANHIEEGSIDLLRDHEAGLLSPIYVVFEFDHATVNSEFMYYLFKSERYKHIFRTSTNASVDRRGSLRWNDFKNLWVPLPERDEQDRLAKLFTAFDKQIEQTQNYLDHLITQKRGLMQQLLTGAVRVKH